MRKGWRRDVCIAMTWLIWTFCVDVLVIGYTWNMATMPLRTIILISMIFKLLLDALIIWGVDSYRCDVENGQLNKKEETTNG